MPPIFSTVSTDCTRPPSATVKQFTSENSRIAPTATSCRGPSCQSIAWPSRWNSRRSHTSLSGRKAARKIAQPEPMLAIDALPATTKRCQPKRKAAACP
jgi:hypothetical protein